MNWKFLKVFTVVAAGMLLLMLVGLALRPQREPDRTRDRYEIWRGPNGNNVAMVRIVGTNRYVTKLYGWGRQLDPLNQLDALKQPELKQ